MNLAVYGNGLGIVMNNVDCIIKCEVYPQKNAFMFEKYLWDISFCSKNIRGISKKNISWVTLHGYSCS